MWISQITEEKLTNEIMDRLLFEGLDDNGENVDCVIVLGSSKAVKYRVPVAANVYFEGRTKKMIMSGGFLPNENISEAERMKNKAMELGVPEKDIIMESNSQNTVENMLCSLLELQRSFWLNKVSSVYWLQQHIICEEVYR